MGQSKEGNSLKSAIVVLGALAFGWLSLEFAFKPFLDKAREAIDKSDPTHDPDEEDLNSLPKSSESAIQDEISQLNPQK